MDLSHLDKSKRARMVDVGDKPVSARTAVAEGSIRLTAETIGKIEGDAIAKGSVLATAQIAGIAAAKRTSELIPLCHNLPLDHVGVEFALAPDHIRARATARTTGRTGVEMEALTAVSAALLTIYDMCKAVDKGMVLEGIRLVAKEKKELGIGD